MCTCCSGKVGLEVYRIYDLHWAPLAVRHVSPLRAERSNVVAIALHGSSGLPFFRTIRRQLAYTSNTPLPAYFLMEKVPDSTGILQMDLIALSRVDLVTRKFALSLTAHGQLVQTASDVFRLGIRFCI